MKAKSWMVLGTASGVGKSVVTAGFCRLLSDWGYKVAPFKAQNMSNNSFVTAAGGEMGRAQVVQAECARVLPTTDMNPVLLKPSSDQGSQVVVHGKPIGNFSARGYFDLRPKIAAAIKESYERLAAQYEILVIEGAGSPAEINLKKNDLVNMKMAELADARCVLVADIDRGGVFASLLGTLELLESHERERIDGLIINKFRGDLSLLTSGLEEIERRSGKKVWGVLPYDRELWIEEEDALSIETIHPQADELIDIAVILLPHLSNFTDFEILKHEPGVRLRYIKHPEELAGADLVVLPGTKATVADFRYLEARGFVGPIKEYVAKGGRLLGVCGGYQMMGETILDPSGAESREERVSGLGFFKMTTTFKPEKILRQVSENFTADLFGAKVSGKIQAYEIHMGESVSHEKYPAFGVQGAIHPSGRLAGTYYHGLFEHPEFRHAFLNTLALSAGKTYEADRAGVNIRDIKEKHYQRLKQLLEQNLDLSFLRHSLERETSHV